MINKPFVCIIRVTAKAWSGDLEVVAGMKGKHKSCDSRNTILQGGEIILVCLGTHKGGFSGKTQRKWTEQWGTQLEEGVGSEVAQSIQDWVNQSAGLGVAENTAQKTQLFLWDVAALACYPLLGEPASAPTFCHTLLRSWVAKGRTALVSLTSKGILTNK